MTKMSKQTCLSVELGRARVETRMVNNNTENEASSVGYEAWSIYTVGWQSLARILGRVAFLKTVWLKSSVENHAEGNDFLGRVVLGCGRKPYHGLLLP